MLRSVGFYDELGTTHHYRSEGSIHDACAAEPGVGEAAVVAYLRSGHGFLDVMEASKDVIRRDVVLTGAPCLFSDGTWVWRLDLAHYVERYHLRLPREFLDHVRANGFSVPTLSEEELRAVQPEILAFF
jgi:hypothetical protein